MNPPKSAIKKWSKALRSGKWKQTTGILQDCEGHCCLGVACEIFIPPRKQRRLNGSFSGGYLVGGTTDHDVQPNAPNWLQNINKSFSKQTETTLIQLNDGQDLNFNEIADCLEAVYILEVLK